MTDAGQHPLVGRPAWPHAVRCHRGAVQHDASSTASSRARLAELIVVGPSPPPTHGVAIMTHQVIGALEQLGRMGGHLDTSDPRPLSTIGRFDATNVKLGLRHAAELAWMLARRPHAGVYIPISQSTWGFVRDALLVAITKVHKRRVLVHLHGGHMKAFYRLSRGPMRLLIRWVFNQVDEAWALTPTLQAQFAGLVAPNRIRCVENVVVDTFGEPASLSPRETRAVRVLYLANLLTEKGCFELVSALRLLGQRCAGWEVRIAGGADAAVEERMRRGIAGLASGGASIELTGAIEGAAKASQFRWATVFAYPTYYAFEGQPLVLLEALAAGLPVVSTRHAGIPDTVRTGVDGILVKPRDVKAFADALLYLADNHAARRQMANAARRRYEERYKPERLVEELRQVFAPDQSPDSLGSSDSPASKPEANA